MKTMQSMSLDVEVVTALKARAEAEMVSASSLVNKALRAFLRMADTGAATPALTTRASLVLGAVKALSEVYANVPPIDPRYLFREFRIDEICRKVGGYPSTTLPALRECERAGVLLCAQAIPLGLDENARRVDHWRLPGT